MFNLIEKIGTTVLVAVPVVAIVLTVMIMKKRMRPSVVRINNIFEVCGFISCHIYILYIILYFQKNIDLSYFLLVTYFISICLISVLLLYSRLIQTLILTSVAFFLFFAVFTITVDAKKKTQDVNWQINDVTFKIPDSAATNISLWINGHKCGLFEQDFQSLTLTLPLEKIVSLPKAKASEDIFSAIDNGKYGMKISLP